jgi:hypothetical protein
VVHRTRVRSCPSAGDRGTAPRELRVFPPRQRPGSFSVEQALEKLRLPPANNKRKLGCAAFACWGRYLCRNRIVRSAAFWQCECNQSSFSDSVGF